ncbi:MAG: SCP2 sterol-binding domain-containing protein [Actinomycetota bacterium]
MAIPFLSDAWLAEVERRLNASEAFRAKALGADATIQQVVPTPEGEERYWIRIAGGSVEVGRGDAADASVTITQDLATAVALAKRELNPVTAFMTGRLKVSGDMGLLMKLQAAVSELPTAMADVEVAY